MVLRTSTAWTLMLYVPLLSGTRPARSLKYGVLYLYTLPGIRLHFFPERCMRFPDISREGRMTYVRQRGEVMKQEEAMFSLDFFGDALSDKLLSISGSPSDYSRLLEAFRSKQIAREELRVLSALQQGVAANSIKLPPLDRHLFHRAIEFLSIGSRADLWKNNRADAINYSLVSRLNRDIADSKIRFVLVSNTRTMHRLDRSLSVEDGLGEAASLFKYGLVRSARSAALYQLLTRVSGPGISAESLAFRIVSNLADYRANLLDAIRQIKLGRSLDLSIPNVDRVIFDVISEFDGRQLEFEANGFLTWDQESVLSDAGHEEESSKFFRKMERFIHDHLTRSGYSLSLEEPVIERAPIRVMLNTENHDRASSFKLVDVFMKEVAFISEDSESILFIPRRTEVEEFLSTLNAIKASIISRIGKEEFNFTKQMAIDVIYLGVGMGPVRTFELSSGSTYTSFELARLIDGLPSDLQFIRVDNPIFSMSSEGDVVTISSRYFLEEESVEFLQAFSEPAHKGSDFVSVMREYRATSRFKFELPSPAN